MKRILKKTIQTANKNWEWWKKKIDERKREREASIDTPPHHHQPKKQEEENTILVEISTLSVLRASLVVIGVIFLSKIALELVDIGITFLLALFLSAVFNPGVDKLEKWGISRGFGIVILFTVVFGFFGLLLAKIIPIIADQLSQIGVDIKTWISSIITGESQSQSIIIQKITNAMGGILEKLNSEKIVQTITNNIDAISNNLSDFASTGAKVVSGTVSAIFNLILVLLLSFFLILDKKSLNEFFHSLFPLRYQGYLSRKTEMVQEKIGQWVHGQVLLFFIVGGIAFLFFLIMGIPYALTLAMVFGLAEFVPYLGPFLSFVISAPVAFNDSLFSGIALLIFYVALQFIEGNLIVPLVMKKAVGLPSIVTILALIVGASFPSVINPVVGMIIAVPVATIVSIFVQDFRERKEKEE